MRGHLRKLLTILHVSVAGQVDIVDLVDEDDRRDCNKVTRVNCLMTVIHEEGGDEETDRGAPHHNPKYNIENAHLGPAPLLIVNHAINDDVEGDEERELSE